MLWQLSEVHTSRTVTGDIYITDAGVWMWKPGELGDERLRNDFGVDCVTLCMASTLDASLPKSGTRSHIVNMFLDIRRHVIGFSRNIVSSRCVLPDVEFSNEKIFNFGGSGVKLNPLKPGSESKAGNLFTETGEGITCLFAESAMRSALIPDSTIHCMTASVVDCSGAKKSMTSSALMCFP